MVEKPALDRAQGHGAAQLPRTLRRSGADLRHGRQFREGLPLEELAGPQGQPPPPRPSHHLHGDDRVAAELEEVVGQAHPLQAQQLAPNLSQRHFRWALRCPLLQLSGTVRCRRRQPAQVHLAIDGQRQRWQHRDR